MSRSPALLISLLILLSAIAWTSAEAKAADGEATTGSNHWSFRPPERPLVPALHDPVEKAWIRNPVDAFILRRLRDNDLGPAAEADRRTLIRRVSFDLTGLPPTPREIEAFLEDRSPTAWEKLVDRLLASPHYGQRWGQHWLDVVRFAETEGFEYDRHHPNAWRFRDYVIRSFNEDKPYDRFVMEQLAGDELAAEQKHPGYWRSRGAASDVAHSSPALGNSRAAAQATRDLQIAAGFHRLGPVRRNAGNAEVAFSRNEVLTERTNIIGSAFLGLTVGCARCHDHKFDPLPQADYYRLQAYLASTYEYDVPLADEKARAAREAKSAQVDEQVATIKKALEDATGAEREQLEQQLKAVEARRPGPLPSIFSVRNVAEKRTPIHVLQRGDENRKGQQVGLRPPGVLLAADIPDRPPDAEKPKTRLARWIVDSENPLTARVMVNRIWQYHFGRGLVETPNDFGAGGRPPSHPELLDWLAVEFIESGWSVKTMHRLILSSSTYRQASHGLRRARRRGAGAGERGRGREGENPRPQSLFVSPSPPLSDSPSGSLALWRQGGWGRSAAQPPTRSPAIAKSRATGSDVATQHPGFSSSRGAAGSAHPHEQVARKIDPENRLLWRFNRRRLTAEEIRDAMLAVSGRLNRKAGGPSVMVPVDPELIALLYKPSQWQVTDDPGEHDRRSIYLIAKRNLRLPFMEVFDQPDLQISCDRRESSTHAPQALELLNGRLSNELARAFARRLRREASRRREPAGTHAEADASGSPVRLVDRAFLLATGRPPTDAERQLAVEFLDDQPLEEFALALFNLNAFLYVE